jgi:hypothetical protein
MTNSLCSVCTSIQAAQADSSSSDILAAPRRCASGASSQAERELGPDHQVRSAHFERVNPQQRWHRRPAVRDAAAVRVPSLRPRLAAADDKQPPARGERERAHRLLRVSARQNVAQHVPRVQPLLLGHVSHDGGLQRRQREQRRVPRVAGASMQQLAGAEVVQQDEPAGAGRRDEAQRTAGGHRDDAVVVAVEVVARGGGEYRGVLGAGVAAEEPHGEQRVPRARDERVLPPLERVCTSVAL